MNGQCSCGYRPGRISPIDCRCVTHRELNERLRKIDPNEGYYQKEIDELKEGKQDKLIAGQNITIEGSLISADLDSTNFYNKTETDALLDEKQNTLTAGNNIVIDENTISSDAHMLVTLTPTGAPVGGVTDYTWTSEYTYAELVASLDKVAFKTDESGSEAVLVPARLYEALEDSQDVIYGAIALNDATVPKVTSMELIVRPDGTAKTTETTALISSTTYTAGDNIEISPTNEISATYTAGNGIEIESGEISLSERYSIIYCGQKGEVQSGDATLIKIKESNVLIDTHLASLKNIIEEFLDRNNATHLDYVILTHYHPDHIGNVDNLVTDGYIDSNTKVFVPGDTRLIDNTASLSQARQTVLDALSSVNATVIQPSEGETVRVEDATFKLYNCTKSVFDDEENYTAYNDCSTVTELSYGNNKVLFTGDIEVKPIRRFERLNMFPYKINLYDLPHHGIEYIGSVLHFVGRITPDFAVQSAELGDFATGSIGQGATTIFLKDKNCKLYSTYNNSQDIIFSMSEEEIICEQGVENYSASNRRPEIPIYVDINVTSSNRDGSQEQPYKDLQEALSRIPQNEHTAFKIYLADGVYEASNESSVLGKISGSTQITIVGNQANPENTVIAHGCFIQNGAYVKYQYVKFTGIISYVENSTLEINSCTAIREDTDTSAAIYGAGNSYIKVISSSFNGGTSTGQAISGHSDDIYVYNCSFENYNTCIQNQYSSSTVTMRNTYTNVTTKKMLYNGALDKSQAMVYSQILWNGNATGTPPQDLTLTDDITSYNELHLYIGGTDSSCSTIISNVNQQNFQVGTTTYYYAFYMRRSGSNTTNEYYKICFPDSKTLRILEQSNTDSTLRTVFGVTFPTSKHE